MSLRTELIEAGAQAKGGKWHGDGPCDLCRVEARTQLDAFLDTLQAMSGRIELDYPNGLSLADEVALSGLSGLIAALREEPS